MSRVQSSCTTYGHRSRSTEKRVPGTFNEARRGANPFINILHLSFNVWNTRSRTLAGKHPFFSGRLCITFAVHDDRPVIKMFVTHAIRKFEKCVEMLQWFQASASANKIQQPLPLYCLFYVGAEMPVSITSNLSLILGDLGDIPVPHTSRSRSM